MPRFKESHMGSGTWGAADENFLNRLRVAGVVPVVTVTDPALAPDLVGALVEGGLPFVEITLRSAAGLDAIRAAQGLGAEIGAGTVTSVASAAAAIDAGASFVVSPGLNEGAVRYCQDAGIPVIPGVATPTEVMAARELGVAAVKLFPAAHLGGPAYLTALAAVWPVQLCMPTGGVSGVDALDYLHLPSVVAVGGSWIAPASLLSARDWDSITELARRAAALRVTAT